MIVPDDRLGADAFRTVRPAYGHGSLADLLPSLSALLGVPGAQDSLGLGAHLAGVDRIAVLLVDGLGAHQLPLIAPYAPAVAGLAAGASTLTSGFPSTTPVSLVTLGTGARPGAHGVLGFTTRMPDGAVLNHIRWADDPPPARWQPVPTRFETAAAAGVAVTAVTRPEFQGSGLTVAAHRGAAFAGASDVPGLVAGIGAALRGAGPALVYGYHPDLDKAGHEAGVGSPPWCAAAREVGTLVDRLTGDLTPGSALVVTADHGQLNVPADRRIDMADDPALSAGVTAVAGEPRVRYLHTAPGARDDVAAAWQARFGPSARVLTRDQVIDEGWFGPVPPAHTGRIGDVVVLCLDRTVALAGDHEPPSVGRLIAYHGSVTAAEMTVPLLIARR